jgi:hypothetical protein
MTSDVAVTDPEFTTGEVVKTVKLLVDKDTVPVHSPRETVPLESVSL